MKLKALIAALLVGLGSGVWAAANANNLRSFQMNGAGFADACARPNESWVSFCNGYVQAVVDGIQESDQICLPARTTRTEIVTVTEREITRSAQMQTMNASVAVRSVLRMHYPCR